MEETAEEVLVQAAREGDQSFAVDFFRGPGGKLRKVRESGGRFRLINRTPDDKINLISGLDWLFNKFSWQEVRFDVAFWK